MNIKPITLTKLLKPSVSNSEEPARDIRETHALDIDNDVYRQCQEMQKMNAELNQMLEQQTKKVFDVINSNTKFISIIAHDLRGPMSTVTGALELLHEKIEHFNSEDINVLYKIAFDSSNKTLSLLDNLLEWALSQFTARGFTPEKLNLRRIVSEAIESIKLLAVKKEIKLNVSIASHIEVKGDAQMIKIVLRNLLGNAIKFTNSGGRIVVCVNENKSFAEVSISDNGVGMSWIKQRKLFSSGFMYSTDGTENEKGYGLGLYLCKEFVELHGGTIRVNSETGRGSEFIFTLPII